jgi:phage baseplate assembly protein W
MPIELITPITKRQTIYSDLRKDIDINPISLDLALYKDEEAVKESIKNLLLTDKGERLMQPLLGGNIRALLFENNTPAIVKLIQEQVKTTILEYEPRAKLLDVIVNSFYDENKIEITVYFYIISVEQPIELTVFLERIR